MKLTDGQRKVLDEFVTALTKAGIHLTRSAMCRLILRPLLTEPQTNSDRKLGQLAVLGPLTVMEAGLLFHESFCASCDRLTETGEADVIVFAAPKGRWYVFVWLSNDYLLRCRLSELNLTDLAAQTAKFRDKPQRVVTVALRSKEKEALKKKVARLGLHRSPAGHCRAAALVVAHFANTYLNYANKD